tara:strand:- start:6401 stop:7234 length:834 start_codon:yes stop_codon:yes gene_type:complete
MHPRISFFLLFSLILLLISCEQSDPEIRGRVDNVIDFSGFKWDIKYGDQLQGPGPNYFTNDQDAVWLDENGFLHLSYTLRNGQWRATEVVSQDTFAYGTYIFTVQGDLVNIPENLVLGLFTWNNNSFASQANSEVDIEFAKWNNDTTDQTLHFSVQPVNFGPYYPERSHNPILNDVNDLIGISTHIFTWTDSLISWASFAGEGYLNKTAIATWSYDLNNPARVKNENGNSSAPIIIPAPENHTNARINYWVLNGAFSSPADEQEHEVIIRSFDFIPL